MLMPNLCLRLFQGTFNLMIEAWHEKADSDEAASFEGEFSIHKVYRYMLCCIFFNVR